MEAWVSNMADGFERFKGDMVRTSQDAAEGFERFKGDVVNTCQDAAEGFERFKRGLVRHCVHMADGFERFKKAVIRWLLSLLNGSGILDGCEIFKRKILLAIFAGAKCEGNPLLRVRSSPKGISESTNDTFRRKEDDQADAYQEEQDSTHLDSESGPKSDSESGPKSDSESDLEFDSESVSESEDRSKDPVGGGLTEFTRADASVVASSSSSRPHPGYGPGMAPTTECGSNSMDFPSLTREVLADVQLWLELMQELERELTSKGDRPN
ncbi:hypothetical protein FOZ61_002292 [Perkinsus olseni]|uniref:Uncharacterized protein n=1 Tax=Perkinsus olseni TaxID=32597 RepID=A0A7J6LV27_PEROL|nr:hypothetical protein FOZ61_002292 [Perkinsus olseni]KAF4668328.1 hypothetical protein FOL46_002058 [Perkinsus olseni]